MEFFSFLGADRESQIRFMLKAAFVGGLNLFKRLANELNEEGDLAITVANSKCSDGRTALHIAAMGGRTRILKYLIDELKLDIDIKDDEGSTPLHHAIQEQHFPAAVFLLEMGANVNAMNEEGLTPLHCAALEGPKKLLELLISKGAAVDSNPDYGTPLQRAAAEGKKDSIKVLLMYHANPNIVSCHTFCPLVLSIINGSIECVKFLLEAKADPNSNSKEGPPLDIVVSRGDIPVIKCLLSAGADPNVTNEGGLTAIEVAAILDNRDAVTTLFPFADPVASFPDWTVDGIMAHIHSKEAGKVREQKLQESFLQLKSKGKEAVEKGDSHDAINYYTKSITCKPDDATMYSNRSFCWANLNDGNKALVDATSCAMLRPDWPKAFYRVGMAFMLLKDFGNAANVFFCGWKLDPKNKDLENALRKAVEAQTTTN